MSDAETVMRDVQDLLAYIEALETDLAHVWGAHRLIQIVTTRRLDRKLALTCRCGATFADDTADAAYQQYRVHVERRRDQAAGAGDA